MAGYYVLTWDMDLQRFTPQKGVRCGPYSLWGLKRALQRLKDMGYTVSPRDSAYSVLVEKRP